jgi:hypothetical protein
VFFYILQKILEVEPLKMYFQELFKPLSLQGLGFQKIFRTMLELGI